MLFQSPYLYPMDKLRKVATNPTSERVLGRYAPCDPSRSLNKQKSKLFCLLSSLRAGDENRTRLYSLGSCRSTDELHPRWHLAAFRV